jgi:hypothetical protein
MTSGNYETMMDVAAEIRDALQPRFLKLTLLGNAREPVLINIANIAAIQLAHNYSQPDQIMGTDIVVNHGIGGDANGASATYRVAESFDDISRGLHRTASVWHAMPKPKPRSESEEL